MTLFPRVVDDEEIDRRYRLPPFVKFLFAGGASVPFNLGSRIWLSTWLDFRLAVVLSHCVGIAVAFTLNRLFVFRRSGRPVLPELLRFGLINIASVTITWCVSVALVFWIFPAIEFHERPELIAHLVGLGCSVITSFIGHSRFTFRPSRSPP